MSKFFNPFGLFQQVVAAWSDTSARMLDTSRAITGAAIAGWPGVVSKAPEPARSWYRAPAPQLPAWPMTQMFAPFSVPQPWGWPLAMWQPPAVPAANAFNPMAFWSPFTPFAGVIPQSWPAIGFVPQSVLAGPLTKACTTFWFELMHQSMAAATSPAAFAALTGSDAGNPFAAYRSDSGHAVAQIIFAPSASPPPLNMFDPAWMSAAFAPFGSKRVH